MAAERGRKGQEVTRRWRKPGTAYFCQSLLTSEAVVYRNISDMDGTDGSRSMGISEWTSKTAKFWKLWTRNARSRTRPPRIVGILGLNNDLKAAFRSAFWYLSISMHLEAIRVDQMSVHLRLRKFACIDCTIKLDGLLMSPRFIQIAVSLSKPQPTARHSH